MVPIALLYVKNWEEECCKQKKEEFREQFRESIQTLSAILKVGYSVENAIRETWKEICPIYKKKTRIIKEYETMVHQLDLNMTAEEVMKQFADRVKEEDVENFVTVFGAAKRLGGDSIAIIRHAADAIGEKMEVEREIQVMLTSKKLEFKIMLEGFVRKRIIKRFWKLQKSFRFVFRIHLCRILRSVLQQILLRNWQSVLERRSKHMQHPTNWMSKT